MGRPSKLTPAQWGDVERRLLAGETARSLGREYGISESAIRGKLGTNYALSAQSAQVRDVAEKLADANRALEALPITHRPAAVSLADQLRSISTSLASAAELGAKTAHRLHALANSEVAKVDDANPLASVESLKNVGILTKLGNDSAHVAINLLAANKDRIKADAPPELPSAELSDDALAAIAAAGSR